MFMYLIIGGGCGGGGSGNGSGGDSPTPRLASLQLSSGTLSPAFNPLTTRYSVNVANSVVSVTVTASASATITVNGTNVTSGSASVALSLNVGANTITIVVSDNVRSTSYTLTVTRAAPPGPDPVVALSNLQISAGTLTPAFNVATLNYTASVPNSVASVTVTPTTTSSGAVITVNGANVTSGSASGAINLNVGANAITIIVSKTSELASYSVTVTREALPAAVYHKLTPSEAVIMLNNNNNPLGYIILDVRTDFEYKEKHFIGAKLIPHTEVSSRAPGELPNKARHIFVYCKAGVRSEMASRALVDLGYTNVYDIGGIDDWPYTVWFEGDPPPTYWADIADTSWWDSAGTSFSISTEAQFAAIAYLSINGTTSFSGQTIILSNDLDLAGFDWTPITKFEGVFDGGGNTISNLRIESSGGAIGLFEKLEASGTVKNFILRDVEIIICPA